jgi:5-methylthioribose kinase
MPTFETIEDEDLRASCEANGVEFRPAIIKRANHGLTIAEANALARDRSRQASADRQRGEARTNESF